MRFQVNLESYCKMIAQTRCPDTGLVDTLTHWNNKSLSMYVRKFFMLRCSHRISCRGNLLAPINIT